MSSTVLGRRNSSTCHDQKGLTHKSRKDRVTDLGLKFATKKKTSTRGDGTANLKVRRLWRRNKKLLKEEGQEKSSYYTGRTRSSAVEGHKGS